MKKSLIALAVLAASGIVGAQTIQNATTNSSTNGLVGSYATANGNGMSTMQAQTAANNGMQAGAQAGGTGGPLSANHTSGAQIFTAGTGASGPSASTNSYVQGTTTGAGTGAAAAYSNQGGQAFARGANTAPVSPACGRGCTSVDTTSNTRLGTESGAGMTAGAGVGTGAAIAQTLANGRNDTAAFATETGNSPGPVSTSTGGVSTNANNTASNTGTLPNAGVAYVTFARGTLSMGPVNNIGSISNGTFFTNATNN